jgi:Tol biopolymer transport system component
MAVLFAFMAAAAADGAAFRPPSASASGTRDGLIAYSIKTGIHVIRADGTGMRVLIPWRTPSCGRGCMTWLVPRHPRWSPDGRQITYHVEKYTVRRNSVEDPSARTVYVADANGSHRRRLGRGHNPDWSPDGSEVVYLRNDATYPDSDWPGHKLGYPDDYGPMRAVNPRTMSARAWPTLGSPAFSPDGQRTVYRTPHPSVPGAPAGGSDDPSQRGLTVAGADGTGPRSFTARTFYGIPVRWTADGRVSYNCYGRGTQPDICLLDPATGRREHLTRTRAFWDLYADSSPSGRYYVVGGLHGLYTTTRTGRVRRVLVRNGSGPSYVPSNVPTEPDWQPRPR